MKLFKNVFVYCVLLLGCEYPLDNIDDSGIAAPPPPGILDLNKNFSGDTIIATNWLNTEIRIEVEEKRVWAYQILLGEDTVRSLEQASSNQIYLKLTDEDWRNWDDPSKLDTGIYKLQIDVFTNTGSGSIGDIVGSEVYAYSLFWYIYIQPIPQNQTELQFDLSGDYLKISWDKMNYPGFQYYLVYKDDFNNENTIDTIFDGNTNYFIDSSYFGYEWYYMVRAVFDRDIRSSDNYLSTRWTYAPKGFPVFKGITKETGRLFINWEKPKYTENYDELRLYKGNLGGVDVNDTEDYIVIDKNTTRIETDEINFDFGPLYWFVPFSFDQSFIENFNNNHFHSNRSFRPTVGEDYPLDLSGVHIFSRDSIIVYDSGEAFLVNANSSEIIEKLPNVNGWASNGFKYIANSTRNGDDYDIEVNNPITGENVFTGSLSSITGKGDFIPRVRVSDNGILTILEAREQIWFYDVIQDELILEEFFSSINPIVNINEISSDGNFILLENENKDPTEDYELYEVVFNDLLQKYELELIDSFDFSASFDRANPNNLIYQVIDNNQWRVIKFNLDSKQEELMVSGDTYNLAIFPIVDYFNKKYIIGDANAKYNLVDFNGKVLLKFNAKKLQSRFYFLNSTLVTGDRFFHMEDFY